MIKVSRVIPESAAEKVGIKTGDEILKINGREINDVLDYRFETVSKKLEIVLKRESETLTLNVSKREYDELGAESETYLMDEKKRCKNACMFCFIDQNPKGMRESIYFKDDDERLSFLQGNYVTLTNLKERDIDRIIEMRISPVNVSVHTMNKELRVKMMKNKNAGAVLDYLPKLSKGGIEINAQLVLCPGVNDGEELRYSLEKLYELETINSVAAVPVGLTKHREGLCPLEAFSKETACNVIETINEFGEKALKERGLRTFYASDEFYLKAGIEIPEEPYYEDYPQIENGVGMLRDHRESFMYALENALDKKRKYSGKRKTIATGVAAYEHIKALVCEFLKAYPKAEINVAEIKNKFFGESVTVSGLLTGGDILSQLSEFAKTEPLGEILMLPENVLKQDEDVFLDNMPLSELKTALGFSEVYTCGEGDNFLETLFA